MLIESRQSDVGDLIEKIEQLKGAEVLQLNSDVYLSTSNPSKITGIKQTIVNKLVWRTEWLIVSGTNHLQH
jgi:hypothetical protein